MTVIGLHQRRLVFVGAVHEAEPALVALLNADVDIALVVTLTECAGADTAGYVDLEPLARAHDVPLLRTRNLNAADVVERIARCQPDLGVVVGWTRLLHEPLLMVPRHGWVGFHASLLPRNRGRAPVNWAIIHGEKVTGNTMMQLSVGTDTGDIIDQVTVPICPDDTCGGIYQRVAEAGAAMLDRHLPALLTGTAPRRPQAHLPGELLPRRTPEMGIVDWDRRPQQVHDWVRALTHPYPGAFTLMRGRRLRIWTTHRPVGHRTTVRPGCILDVDDDDIRVAARGGSIRLAVVQEDGHEPEPAGRWGARRGIFAGDRFDPVDPQTARWALGLAPKPAVGVLPYSARVQLAEAVNT